MTNTTVSGSFIDSQAEIEEAIRDIGSSMWSHLRQRKPTLFERRWWDDRILAWAMSNEAVKIQLLRFVDVLPMLRTADSVTRHLQEYYEEIRAHLPRAARIALDFSQPNTILGRALSLNVRRNTERMARRFIAGPAVDEIEQTIVRFRLQGLATTVAPTGISVISEPEAEQYYVQCLDLIQELAVRSRSWTENQSIDFDVRGDVPRVTVAVRISSLCSRFRPLDAAGTADIVKPRLRALLQAAREYGVALHVEAEQSHLRDLALQIFHEVLGEEELRDFPDAGLTLQAYSRDCERHLSELLDAARHRKTPLHVRLVKGDCWDHETRVATLLGWPRPVWEDKSEIDDNFERHTRFLLQHHQWLRPTLATHQLRGVAQGLAWARHYQLPESALQFQMLAGVGNEQAQLLAELGHRARLYLPAGELIPGMSGLCRWLLENPSNEVFLRSRFGEPRTLDEMLQRPAAEARKTLPMNSSALPRFENTPRTDFSIRENRDAMQAAIDGVRRSLGKEYPLVINGRAIETRERITTRNPSQPTQVVGRVSCASPDEAAEAIGVARAAFPAWSRTEVQYRAEYLELVAAELRRRKFELAAWIILEVGKPWEEADAEVAEAIDFCLYYASEMRRLAVPRETELAGEENTLSYRSRGVVVTISPWNFPLAVLTGMTAAALVTGNTIVMKPAEQASVVGYKLFQIYQDVGIPAGVINYLPGIGSEIGQELVGSPDVSVVAFTGSQSVGLSINQMAAVTDDRQDEVKRVVAEMGGKNAIIIDDDADLEDAVTGVIESAFGYAGQKCSACSRVIVLKGIQDAFLKRLVTTARDLRMGPATDTATTLGPVIDEASRDRLLEMIQVAASEGQMELADEPDRLPAQGYFVGPHIVSGVSPQARIAQEELFGPILAVIPARDFDEALEIANSTRYAMTGGVYSRSPVNLKRARQEFIAGNLYLNRPITGALVERQPFGGYRMSGIGSKSGGPDYLLQFLIPVSVTENAARRGYTPVAAGTGETA